MTDVFSGQFEISVAGGIEDKVKLTDWRLVDANSAVPVYEIDVVGKEMEDVTSQLVRSLVASEATKKFNRPCGVSMMGCRAAVASDPTLNVNFMAEYNKELVHGPIKSTIEGEVVFVDGKTITLRLPNGSEQKIRYPSPRSKPAVKVGDQVKSGDLLFEELKGIKPDEMVFVSTWRVTVS